MLGCSGEFASSCQTTTINSCLSGGQETQILLPSGGVKMALQHLRIASVTRVCLAQASFGGLCSIFLSRWAVTWFIDTQQQNSKNAAQDCIITESLLPRSKIQKVDSEHQDWVLFAATHHNTFFSFLSFCLFMYLFFTERKLLQLLKSQSFLCWLNFCWVWLNIGASLSYLSQNQIYAAISFFCLPVSEPFGLSLILSRFMFCCTFCPSLSHNNFPDIPLHHQTSNEVFCYIKLMVGEDRERKARNYTMFFCTTTSHGRTDCLKKDASIQDDG